MSFTKKVKTGNCKILIITYKFFVNLLSTLTNQPANQLVKITNMVEDHSMNIFGKFG
jgi:hypothetical protein